jgi:hypothetical protein
MRSDRLLAFDVVSSGSLLHLQLASCILTNLISKRQTDRHSRGRSFFSVCVESVAYKKLNSRAKVATDANAGFSYSLVLVAQRPVSDMSIAILVVLIGALFPVQGSSQTSVKRFTRSLFSRLTKEEKVCLIRT